MRRRRSEPGTGHGSHHADGGVDDGGAADDTSAGAADLGESQFAGDAEGWQDEAETSDDSLDEAIWAFGDEDPEDNDLDSLLAEHLDIMMAEGTVAEEEAAEAAVDENHPPQQDAQLTLAPETQAAEAEAMVEDDGAAAAHPVPEQVLDQPAPGPALLNRDEEAGMPDAEVAGPPQPKRVPAEEKLDWSNGVISYYHTKRIFTATCGNPDHGKCTLTRTACEGRNPAQGRPLGLMKCWLEMGLLLPSKEDHWHKEAWPTMADRQEARHSMLADPRWMPLLEFERPQRAGEGQEPDSRP